MALKFGQSLGGQGFDESTYTVNDAGNQYDIVADRDTVVARLAGSDEIEALTSTINVYDMNTILTFGKHAAEEISKTSDALLRGMNMSQLDKSNEMMGALARIMEQFDPEELEGNPSLLGKLFGGARKQLDRVLSKYQSLGNDVDQVYIGLRQYESEIKQNNQKLETMFRANVGYFHELEKYIVAGEQGCIEIETYIDKLKQQQKQTGDTSIEFEIQTLNNALNMLEQRTHDLKLAEAVAMQSIPMIQLMQLNNTSLAQKINSTFIVTLPVFKQALAQAILLKQQSIQADAMSALNQHTNEMIRRNARSIYGQEKRTTHPASGNGIVPTMLQDSQKIIMEGIAETKQLQDSMRVQREHDQARLENIRQDYMRQSGSLH